MSEMTDSLPFNLPPSFDKAKFDEMLTLAFKLGASDVSLQTEDYVYFMIGGKQVRASTRCLQRADIDVISKILYAINAPALLSQSEALDPRYEFSPYRGERLGFRCNMLSARVDGNDKGVSITLRVLPKTPPDISAMDVPAQIVNNLFPRNGLIVIAGVTSSGKSTLIASGLKMQIENKSDPRKIATYEKPIEFIFDGIETDAPKVAQTPIGGSEPGLRTFHEATETAMRRALSIILIGECRDAGTISGCIDMALTGHCTLTTVHAKNVGGAFRRMVAMAAESGGGNESVSERLLGSISMIVVQTLCPTLDGKRMPLREWIVVDRTLQERLFEGDFSRIASELQREVMARGSSMGHSAARALRDGRISLAHACAYSGLNESELSKLVINDSVFSAFNVQS